jgi:hypothetical protein
LVVATLADEHRRLGETVFPTLKRKIWFPDINTEEAVIRCHIHELRVDDTVAAVGNCLTGHQLSLQIGIVADIK